MPIYEYECSSCGTRFDKLVGLISASEESCPVCPHCGSEETHRIPSAFAVTGSPAGVVGAEPDSAPPFKPEVTAKEDIDRWRKQSTKKK
jgi:putative FmdB family regulatory protein